MVNLFWEKNMEKYPTGLKFAPKIIPDHHSLEFEFPSGTPPEVQD